MGNEINIKISSKLKSQGHKIGKLSTTVNYVYENGIKISITTYKNGACSVKANCPYSTDPETGAINIVG
jgi:hypothetical protein